jgi:hypothetical protein
MINSGFDPAVIPVIARVARLAGINSTLAVSQDGQTFTAQEKFELDMVNVIQAAHWIAEDDPMLLKRAKRVRQLACKLEGELQDSYLLRRLPFSDVRAVTALVNELYALERRKKHGRSKKWAKTIREQFVIGLLDAADAAGGRLGTNSHSRTGRGTLVEAVSKLRPYLPPGLFSHGLSARTLRSIRAAWAKNRKK